MISKIVPLTLTKGFFTRLKDMIGATIILILFLMPKLALCQAQNLNDIIKSTKEFLKTISFSNDTLKGIIVIVPREPQISELRYEKNGEIIRRPINQLTPHPQFFVLENFDLNTLYFTYYGSTHRRVIDFFSIRVNIANINDFHDKLILINLPVESVAIDTFQINPLPPQIIHETIRVFVRDTIVCTVKREFPKILSYSLLPGGGRFYAGHPWQGIGMALLQVAPIPFAIHYDNQRRKFLDRAKEAAARGDQAAVDENFDKSQVFRHRAGLALGVTATAYLINAFDVLINVKGIRCEPLVSADGVRLNIKISTPP